MSDFHSKYLHCCFEDEQKSNSFGTTWGWVIDDNFISIFWMKPISQNQKVPLKEWVFSHNKACRQLATIYSATDKKCKPATCLVSTRTGEKSKHVKGFHATNFQFTALGTISRVCLCMCKYGEHQEKVLSVYKLTLLDGNSLSWFP